MDYKIGVLAKLFGITPQTLRFYEKEGLMPAFTQPYSTTRRYYARNFKWLSGIRRYYMQGFGTEEIKRLFQCETPAEIARGIAAKEAEHRREIDRLSKLVDVMQENRGRIERMDELLYQCCEEDNPELVMIINQKRQQLDDSPEMLDAVTRWMTYLPFVDSATVVDRSILDERAEHPLRRSGFMIEADLAGRIGLEIGPPAQRIAPRRCLHTVTILQGDSPESFAHCAEYLRAHRLAACADPFGRCLVKVHEEYCKTTLHPNAVYYEYWIPVEDA